MMKSFLTGLEIDPEAPPELSVQQPSLGPLLRGVGGVFVQEPEMSLAAVAFVVGLFAPKRERLCGDVAMAYLRARTRRTDSEGADEIVAKMTDDRGCREGSGSGGSSG